MKKLIPVAVTVALAFATIAVVFQAEPPTFPTRARPRFGS